MSTPCSWDVSCDVCPGFADYEPAIRDSALWLASTFLWAATGRRYGVCPVTVRPSQSRLGAPPVYQAYPVWPGQEPVGGPFLFGGNWFNSGCATACCGDESCTVVLRGPVASVISVIADGEEIDPSAYRVDVSGGSYLLVRVDGGCWPSCPGMFGEGTFEITYGYGIELPDGLAIATALLACEYGKFLSGGACRLPTRMTRLARQGVEVEVTPPEPAQGMTGIAQVDAVIIALNPGRRQSPPMALSPDVAESCDRMTVIPAGG